MNKKLRYLGFASAPVMSVALLCGNVVADEPGAAGSRYEDDAWYDVSEWFDGNDYNPTDEAVGRWDDERFSYRDELSSADNDNDSGAEMVDAEEFYGEDWDDGHGVYADNDKDGNYESYSRYHDTDGDHLNDSYATYRDDDGDGKYDSNDFREFTGKHSVHNSNVAQTTQEGLSGKREKVSGEIMELKAVLRAGRIVYLLQVKDSSDKMMWVDMGSANSYQLFKGDTLTAMGPITKAGDKKVLVATTIEVDGKQIAVVRTGRRYSGTIQSTKTATVRGEKRSVAKMKTADGKMLTVDMGSAGNAKPYKTGDQLNVTGVPVKIGDRVILIADKNSLK